MKQKKILFLVKNYIGFGHIRRCIIIANEIYNENSTIDIYFISQAKSLNLFFETNFKVINFPYLEMLPSNAFVAAYKDLLDCIVEEINPDLVIEDTYPDNWYLNIPCLKNVPRILLLRRIDPISFDNYRFQGYYSNYNKIIVLHKLEEICKDQVPESEIVLRKSNKFFFSGPVYHLPSEIELIAIKDKYKLSNKIPTIVVNAGAGGDHFNEAYCDRLFSGINLIAEKINEVNLSANFIFVVGPYFKLDRFRSHYSVQVVDFEPYLAALLHLADIAIIRPGFNVLHEALSGNARVIILPGNSYMETQNIYSNQLCSKYNVIKGSMDDLENLKTILIDLLSIKENLKIINRNKLLPMQNVVAKEVISELKISKKIKRSLTIFILIGNIPIKVQCELENANIKTPHINLVLDNHVIFNQSDIIPSISSVTEISKKFSEVFFSPPFQTYITPQWLKEKGIEILFFSNKDTKSLEWYKKYGAIKHGILGISLEYFRPYSNIKREFLSLLDKILISNNSVGIYIDVEQYQDLNSFINFMGILELLLNQSNVKLLRRNQFIQRYIDINLLGKNNAF